MKKNKKLTGWKKINNLTNLAYKKSYRNKFKALFILFTFMFFIISFASITIFSSLLLLSNNEFRSIIPTFTLPNFDWNDIKFLMYDSEGSVKYDNIMDNINAKNQEFLDDNPSFKVLCNLLGIKASDLKWNFYEDSDYSKLISPEYLAYNGMKTIYISVEIKKMDFNLDLGSITVPMINNELFYDNFFLFKQYALDNSQASGTYNSSYVPKNFYTVNMPNNLPNDYSPYEQLLDYVTSFLDQFLTNEKQETGVPLKIHPLITKQDDHITFFDPTSELVSAQQLQKWFKNPNNKYLDKDNIGTSELDLTDGTKYNITYFSDSFNVSDFIDTDKPLEYFYSRQYSVKPIYEINKPLVPVSSEPVSLTPHIYHSTNTSIDFYDYYCNSLFLSYTKTRLFNSSDEKHLQDTILKYAYDSLCSSVERSFPDWSKSGVDFLATYYGISNVEDLKNKLQVLSPERDVSWTIDKVTTKLFPQIRSISFDLPNSQFPFDWKGVINFYE